MAIILNILGLILIVYSIITIRKDLSKDDIVVDDLISKEAKVEDYYNLTEEIVKEFDEIIDNKIELAYKKNDNYKLYDLDYNNKMHLNKDKFDNDANSNFFHKKVIELKDIGLTNEEIAKKLNKGIREIEIILKMYGNRKI